MTESYTGLGEAYIVGSKCNKLIPFTSSYKWTWSGDPDFNFFKINYNNSFIGSRILSAIISDVSGILLSSDGLLNFTTHIYYDIDTESNFLYVTITGLFKKCKYSSEELDIFIPTASSAALSTFKKNSKNSDEFHKLLDSKPNLKKKYLQLKAKKGK